MYLSSVLGDFESLETKKIHQTSCSSTTDKATLAIINKLEKGKEKFKNRRKPQI